MATKSDLVVWVQDALKDHGGIASIVEVARHIWMNHEPDLRASGDMFYTWQYDMRWAAQRLVDKKILDKTTVRGQWRVIV
ncbi:hypothetical protein ACTTAL_13080 [Rhodobacter capsulatus]|uniref:hypothetical protein n=1 Tax=Rhodobacter capsulatus TaxID=1061 RepID=UPI0004CF610D|nr:hypothetical protein [Rhodobacter capsulatus]